MTSNPVPTVLVVEPDKIQSDLIHLCLTRIGCNVVHANTSGQTINSIRKDYPSLLILDTFIPGSSGLEILHELNQKNILKHTRVLLISSFGFQEIIHQAKKLGVNEFIMKPLDLELLQTESKNY
jgi:CheY-like chemotaxis protein